MKKSLSILLAIALVFGLFASMASAADAAMTTAEKYKVLVDKGILKGTTTGSDELDGKLTRAQFATIAVALGGLTPATEGATFSDVTNKQWWYGAIEAAAKAGLVEGTGDGKFTPRADVTVESVIKVAVALAKIEPVKDAKVEGASDWAGPYIKAALDKGLISTGLDYKAAATRGQTVDIGYVLYAATQAPAKASVTSAKATNVDEVTVVLDKAVDDTKATLTLKRGTATVATTAKWSDDKKTVTLALTSTKITEADYSVTLAGLAAEEIGTATASFKGEAEKVVKLEFVTTSDDIAYTNAARVKLRAENQYGKLASFNSANFTVNADATLNASITKDSEGYLVVKLDTKTAFVGTQGLSQIPIYVYSNDNHLTAFKTFKLGFAPFVSKSELGKVKYDNGKTALINSGDTATADLKLFDQYGNPITLSQFGVGATPLPFPTFNSNVIPYAQDITVTQADYDNDDEYEVRIALNKKADKAVSHTLTLYVGSSNSQVTFEIGTSKVATSIEFDSFDSTLATGDTGKYVTFSAYDANGDKLTAQEIADNAKIVAPATTGRFTLTASGVTSASIVTVGPNKGKIALGTVNNPKNSFVFLTLSVLSPNANSIKTLQIPVADVRVPSTLVVTTQPAPKAVLGATSKFVIVAKDQYGDTFDKLNANYQIQYDFEANGTGTVLTGTNSALMMADGVSTIFNDADSDHYFDTAPGVFGRATLKATLKKDDPATAAVVWADAAAPVTVAIESIDPSKTELNYSIADITSLYASMDNSSLFPTAWTAPSFLTSQTRKEIALTVKDNAGNTVAYPANIQDITTSNNLVAQVVGTGTTAHVVGNKAGDATVTAVVYKANGETTTLTAKVTVKSDAVVAAKMTVDNGSVDMVPAAPAAAIVVNGSDAGALMGAKLTDNYGIEYNAANIQVYQKLLGVRYTVSEFSGATVSINATTGVLSGFTQTAIDYQFVVTATAPNGQSTSTIFHNN